MNKSNRRLGCRVDFIVVLMVLIAAPAFSVGTAKEDTSVPRILLVGDSWPWFLTTGLFLWSYDAGSAFRDVLPETGRGRWSDRGLTAAGGSMVTQWSANEPMSTPYGFMGRLDFVRREFMEFPSIDIVHLSLGGNDYIKGDLRGYVHHEDGRPYKEFQWQTLVFTGPPSGGAFTLTFDGQTTPPIAFGADASAVESALASLSTIGAGNVSVISASGIPTYFFEFKGVFADMGVPSMSCDGSLLASGGMFVQPVTFDHGWKGVWGTESPAERAFAQAIFNELQIVTEFILDTRADVRVVICDYDYMEEDFGGVSVRETNECLVRSGRVKRLLADTLRAKPQYAGRCFYHDTFGLMQWWFGYPCDYELISEAPNEVRRQTTLPQDQYYGPKGAPGTKGAIQPPGTYPDYTPWAGGDVSYPGPAIGILFDFGKSGIAPDWAKDAKGRNFHLSKEGCLVYARYCVEKFYGAWLDQPKVIAVRRITHNPMFPAQVFDPNGLAQVAFEVEFSEPVSGVDEMDFSTIDGNGLAGASIDSVTPGNDGATYEVVVNTGSGDGTLGLAINDNGSITANDDATPLAGDLNGYFGYGEKYTVNRAYGLPVAAWPMIALLLFVGVWRARKPDLFRLFRGNHT